MNTIGPSPQVLTWLCLRTLDKALREVQTVNSVPARVRHYVNPAKDREMAPTKSIQGPLWPFSFFNCLGLKWSLLLQLQ